MKRRHEKFEFGNVGQIGVGAAIGVSATQGTSTPPVVATNEVKSVLVFRSALSGANISALGAELAAFQTGLVDGAHCTAVVTDDTVSVGTEVEITVTAYDAFDNPITFGGATVVGTVSGEVSGTCAVVDNDDGTYTVTYTPDFDGEYLIGITVNGNQILSSPFVITVSDSRLAFHMPLATDLTEVTGNGTPAYTCNAATTMGINGLLYHYAANQPRIHPVYGLLDEPRRTNAVPNSQDFSTFENDWNGGVTLTENDDYAPDGQAIAAHIARIDSDSDGLNVAVALTASGVYVASAWLKADDAGQSAIQLRPDSGSGGGEILIDWTGGVPSLNSGTGHSNVRIKEWFNGYYRIQFACTNDTSTTGQLIIRPETGGAGTEGIYVFGPQVEQHVATNSSPAIASTYIPTSGTPVQRPRCELIITGSWTTLLPDSAGSKKATVTITDHVNNRPGDAVVNSFRNAGVSDFFFGGNPISLFFIHDNTTGSSIAHGFTAFEPRRLAVRWNNAINEKQSFSGGNASSVGAYDGTLNRAPSTDRIYCLGSSADGGLFGWHKDLKGYNADLGTTDLTAWTAG